MSESATIEGPEKPKAKIINLHGALSTLEYNALRRGIAGCIEWLNNENSDDGQPYISKGEDLDNEICGLIQIHLITDFKINSDPPTLRQTLVSMGYEIEDDFGHGAKYKIQFNNRADNYHIIQMYEDETLKVATLNNADDATRYLAIFESLD